MSDEGGRSGELPEGWTREERSFRGISQRLAVTYLQRLGGEANAPPEEADRVEADGWRAALSSERVKVAGSLSLTEVSVRFEGEPETLESVVEQFAQKAMRAGG